MNFINGTKFDEEMGQTEYVETKKMIDMAYTCQVLIPAKTKEKIDVMAKANDNHYYSFNIRKVYEIFYLLLADGQIKLVEDRIIPSKDELVGKKYQKWHHSWSHNIIDYIVLRKNIQEAIQQGKIKFAGEKEKSPMEVDVNPFPMMTGVVS